MATLTPRELAERMHARRRQQPDDGWKRHTVVLPRDEARIEAARLLREYPKAAYFTSIENWRALPDDKIEFTIRRLPTAD